MVTLFSLSQTTRVTVYAKKKIENRRTLIIRTLIIKTLIIIKVYLFSHVASLLCLDATTLCTRTRNIHLTSYIESSFWTILRFFFKNLWQTNVRAIIAYNDDSSFLILFLSSPFLFMFFADSSAALICQVLILLVVVNQS